MEYFFTLSSLRLYLWDGREYVNLMVIHSQINFDSEFWRSNETRVHIMMSGHLLSNNPQFLSSGCGFIHPVYI